MGHCVILLIAHVFQRINHVVKISWYVFVLVSKLKVDVSKETYSEWQMSVGYRGNLFWISWRIYYWSIQCEVFLRIFWHLLWVYILTRILILCSIRFFLYLYFSSNILTITMSKTLMGVLLKVRIKIFALIFLNWLVMSLILNHYWNMINF